MRIPALVSVAAAFLSGCGGIMSPADPPPTEYETMRSRDLYIALSESQELERSPNLAERVWRTQAMEVVLKFAARYPEICFVRPDGAACAVMRPVVVKGAKYEGLFLFGFSEDDAGNRCKVRGLVEQSEYMQFYEYIRVSHTPTPRYRITRSGDVRDASSTRHMHSTPENAANISNPETLLRRCRAIGG